METTDGSFRMGLVSRTLALGLACIATSLIFTSVTIVFTAAAGGDAAVSQLAQGAPALVAYQA